MVRTFLGLLGAFSIGLTACGGSTVLVPDDPGVRRVTLESTIGDGQGVILETGTIVADEDQQAGDVYLHLGKVMSLAGPDGGFAFCRRGEGHSAVTEIPTDEEGCTYNHVYLDANSPPTTPSDRSIQRDGYLVRDRAGRLYAVLILEHSITTPDEGGVARVTFDVLAVE